jgi:hypothetical protein
VSKRRPKLVPSVALAAIGALALAVACSSPTSGDGGGGGGGGNAALTGVSISPNTVNAGAHATGSVTLSAGAPSAGAVVALSSNASDRATVPGSATVVAGATSATFDIATLSGASAGTATITGTYLGINQSAILTVNVPTPAAHADFTVTPNAGTAANPGQCAVFSDTRNGQLLNELRCTFDAGLSTPSTITEYRWTLPSAAGTVEMTGKTLISPTVGCGTFAASAQRDVTLRITAPNGTDTITKSITFIKTAPC